jgi:hypothetical protein
VTTAHRCIRIVKHIGVAPCVAACTSCGQQFQAPLSALRSVKDATDNLQKQFDAHKCAVPVDVMQSVVSQLHKERIRLADELHRVTAALTAFGKVYVNGPIAPRKKRTMSAAGRKRIVAAQKARWAKIKAGKKRASKSKTN